MMQTIPADADCFVRRDEKEVPSYRRAKELDPHVASAHTDP